MKRKTDHIAQHLLWRGFYFFSILLINIGIARFFAAEKSGQVFYIVNNLSLIILIVSLSLESGAAYYISSGKIRIMTMARLCLIWTVMATPIAMGIWWLTYPNAKATGYFSVVSVLPGFLFIAGVLFTTYFTSLFYACREFGLPNKILFGVNGLFIFILIFGRNWAYLKDHFLVI